MESKSKSGPRTRFRLPALVFAACVGLLLAGLSGCNAGNGTAGGQRVIRLAYLPITHSVALMMLPSVASDGDEFRVELVRFTTWPEVAEALRSGHVDGASILFEVAATAHMMGSQMGVVSLSHRDGNVLVVDNTVEDIFCLVGRTVAIPHSHSPHYTLLNKVLTDAGLTLDDINLVEISPAEMPFSMAARAISAYVVAEPWGSLAQQRGVGRILVDSRDVIPDSVCCLFVMNESVIAYNDGLLDWLHGQFHLAAELASLGGEGVVEAFRLSTGFDREIILQSLGNTNFHMLGFSEDDFEATIANVLMYGVLSDFPDFCGFSLMCEEPEYPDCEGEDCEDEYEPQNPGVRP